MKRDDVFPSKYLKASDLSGKPITVKIGSAPLETLKTPDGKEQQKICLYLIGAKKVLPLNATNWDAVADIAGDDTDTWPGNSIELYPTKTQLGGKTIGRNSWLLLNLGYVGCVVRAKIGGDRWYTQRSESGWPNTGVASIRSPKSAERVMGL